MDLGKRITDFAPSTAIPDEPVAGDALDEDIGVAVEFEGEDEEEDSEGDEVVVRSHSAAIRQRTLDLCALPKSHVTESRVDSSVVLSRTSMNRGA